METVFVLRAEQDFISNPIISQVEITLQNFLMAFFRFFHGEIITLLVLNGLLSNVSYAGNLLVRLRRNLSTFHANEKATKSGIVAVSLL